MKVEKYKQKVIEITPPPIPVLFLDSLPYPPVLLFHHVTLRTQLYCAPAGASSGIVTHDSGVLAASQAATQFSLCWFEGVIV